jgi:hypothetical protein
MSSRRSPLLWPIVGVCAVVGFIILILLLTAATWVRTDGGHVAVVRNGGPFDNNQIKDVIQPASGRKYEGMYSQTHLYPASQRYYTIAASGGDRSGVDVFTSSTSDGVTVGLEGSVQFTLNTDPATLRKFDDKFGTRTFPSPDGDDLFHPWDGDKGWNAFLDSVFRRQVLDNALRIEMQGTPCTDLVPSCVYVNTPVSASNGNNVTPKVNGNQANANLGRIQSNISTELQTDLDRTLGGRYLTIGQFTISKVTLTDKVQSRIDDANSAKVEVQRQVFLADQRVAKARGDRDSNIAKATGIKALNAAYANSPAKARIDAITALCGDSGCSNLQVIGGDNQNLLNLGK